MLIYCIFGGIMPKQPLFRKAGFIAGILLAMTATSVKAISTTPDWQENFDVLDSRRWTREVTTAGGGNFEFQFYTDSEQNAFVKNGILHLKPGLAKDYVLTDGQSFGCGTGVGGNKLGTPGSMLNQKTVLGCGRTDPREANTGACPVWKGEPELSCGIDAQHFWFDLGNKCTDDGSGYGMTNRAGCLASSGYFVKKIDPKCTAEPCRAYWNLMNPVTSGRISTKNASDDVGGFQYGRIEIKAKIPRGDWLWPAIWMLPKNPKYRVNDPTVPANVSWPFNGEIDIMESRGNSRECSEAYMKLNPDKAAGGVQSFGSALHFGPRYDMNGFERTHTEYSVPKNAAVLSDRFHTYGLRWNEKGLYTYIDDDANHVLEVVFDKTFWDKANLADMEHCLKRGPENPGGNDAFSCVLKETIKRSNWLVPNPWPANNTAAPFDQPFYLVLNVAVGGMAGQGDKAYSPDKWCNKPWTTMPLKDNGENNYAVAEFTAKQDQWLSTWMCQGNISDDAALQVDSVQYWKEQNAGDFSLITHCAL